MRAGRNQTWLRRLQGGGERDPVGADLGVRRRAPERRHRRRAACSRLEGVVAPLHVCHLGGSGLALGWFREIQIPWKLSDMSWSRGADVERPTESLYAEFLGAEWQEVEQGIFVRGEPVALDLPGLKAIPATSP